MGKDSTTAAAQLIRPIMIPSMTTDLMISKSTAPIARMTPISRVRSSTFIPMVPARPMLPTTAVNNAIDNKKITKILICCPCCCRVTNLPRHCSICTLVLVKTNPAHSSLQPDAPLIRHQPQFCTSRLVQAHLSIEKSFIIGVAKCIPNHVRKTEYTHHRPFFSGKTREFDPARCHRL